MTTENKRYIEAVGRRKTSVARVRITPASKNSITVNAKPIASYFTVREHKLMAEEALAKGKATENFSVTALVSGGGIASQADAVRHGIARALIIFDIELRGNLKKLGFLKRDPRAKERRKPGLKKARKGPRWSKR